MKKTWSFIAVFLCAVFKTGECAISGWTSPTIATADGSGTLTEMVNDGATVGDTLGITLTATTDGSITSYTIASQSPTSPAFAIDSSGVLSISSGTVSYSTTTSFTLTVTANDGADATATITLNVNAAPTIDSHSSSVCIADASGVGVDLIALSATDANSGTTITWAIDSGNTNTDFEITTGGALQVVTDPLDMATTSSYTLVITAEDDSSTPLTATTTVTGTVQTTCSSASAIAISLMSILAALMATKLF